MVSWRQSTPSMPKCCKASRLGRQSRRECGSRPTRLNLPKIRRSIQFSWRRRSRPKTVRRMRKLTRYRLATPSQASSVGESSLLLYQANSPPSIPLRERPSTSWSAQQSLAQRPRSSSASAVSRSGHTDADLVTLRAGRALTQAELRVAIWVDSTRCRSSVCAVNGPCVVETEAARRPNPLQSHLPVLVTTDEDRQFDSPADAIFTWARALLLLAEHRRGLPMSDFGPGE